MKKYLQSLPRQILIPSHESKGQDTLFSHIGEATTRTREKSLIFLEAALIYGMGDQYYMQALLFVTPTLWNMMQWQEIVDRCPPLLPTIWTLIDCPGAFTMVTKSIAPRNYPVFTGSLVLASKR